MGVGVGVCCFGCEGECFWVYRLRWQENRSKDFTVPVPSTRGKDIRSTAVLLLLETVGRVAAVAVFCCNSRAATVRGEGAQLNFSSVHLSTCWRL